MTKEIQINMPDDIASGSEFIQELFILLIEKKQGMPERFATAICRAVDPSTSSVYERELKSDGRRVAFITGDLDRDQEEWTKGIIRTYYRKYKDLCKELGISMRPKKELIDGEWTEVYVEDEERIDEDGNPKQNMVFELSVMFDIDDFSDKFVNRIGDSIGGTIEEEDEWEAGEKANAKANPLAKMVKGNKPKEEVIEDVEEEDEDWD